MEGRNMDSNTLLQPSVGADLSRPLPIYRPFPLVRYRINVLLSIIAPTGEKA